MRSDFQLTFFRAVLLPMRRIRLLNMFRTVAEIHGVYLHSKRPLDLNSEPIIPDIFTWVDNFTVPFFPFSMAMPNELPLHLMDFNHLKFLSQEPIFLWILNTSSLPERKTNGPRSLNRKDEDPQIYILFFLCPL